jgi:hypothetical protein
MKPKRILFLTVFLVAMARAGFGLAASSSDATQTVSGGGVTVKVTFASQGSNDDPRFRVVLDTHSVGLDGYDLKTLAVLRDDQGRTYAPSGLENKGGGHHRDVTLIFPKVSTQTKSLELIIKEIAGVKERKFRWAVQ